MSLEIYFDNELINEQYYTGLNNNNELFNESFKLGATPCNQFTLRIAKEAITEQPNEIHLYEDGILFADLEIDNIEEEDYEYVYTLTDKIMSMNFTYDASEIFVNGHTTLYDIANDICTKVGLTLGTGDFRGYDKVITWYDNTRTARDYIGFIAELNGGFARVENNTLYFKKQKSMSVATINIDDCEDFKIGEKHKITRVVYELGAIKYEFGNETGNTLYLNSDNVYITEESEVEAIFNDVYGFEFYSFTSQNCPISRSIKAGDVITFTDGVNNFPTIAQYDLTYFGGWYGGYDLDINTEKQEETQIIGDKQNIKNLRIIVDRDANTITQVVEEVGEQNQKISQVTQTVNELNSKISDIADITTQAETTNALLTFTSINQSEPIEIMIRPTTQNISYLYPRANLYPEDILYMPDRKLRFTNTTTDEIFEYTLPDDLLISQNGVYDEFYLGYDQHICQVTKRCGYNADGSVYELADEVITTYTYPIIELTDGDYRIELLGYGNAYMSIRLMAQNIYTTQFATRAEVNSEINQAVDEIDLSVNQKLTNYSTTSQMNSAITLKADEINSSVSETLENYSTTTQMNSAITQSASRITSTVSQTYETKENAQSNYSQIDQNVSEVSIEVGKKYNTSDFTNAKITAKINDGTSNVKIDADKIDLSGKTINMTSDNIKIQSTNFNVTKNGKMTCNDAEITGGKLNITAPSSTEIIKLTDSSNNNRFVSIGSNSSVFQNVDGISSVKIHNNYTGVPTMRFVGNTGTCDITDGVITISDNIDSTTIFSSVIYTPRLVQTSLESIKKNIEKSNLKALEIIKNSDIYSYNLKSEEDTTEKHLGFVIGEKYNTPKEVIANGRGIDTYTMASIMWKALQEQQEQIETLKEKIEKLEGGNE